MARATTVVAPATDLVWVATVLTLGGQWTLGRLTVVARMPLVGIGLVCEIEPAVTLPTLLDQFHDHSPSCDTVSHSFP